MPIGKRNAKDEFLLCFHMLCKFQGRRYMINLRIMFWNTHHKNTINPVIFNIVQEKKIDIVALAEYSDDINTLCSELKMHKFFSEGCNTIVTLGKRKKVDPGVQAERYTIQIIDNHYIICVTHLPSKLHTGSDDSRRIVIQQMIKDLKDQEAKINSSCSKRSV